MTATNGRYSLNSRVRCQIVENEAVLLDLDSGEYFGLNQVGTRIWELLGAGHTLPSIAELLSQEFEVTDERATADLEQFVGELAELGLVGQVGQENATL